MTAETTEKSSDSSSDNSSSKKLSFLKLINPKQMYWPEWWFLATIFILGGQIIAGTLLPWFHFEEGGPNTPSFADASSLGILGFGYGIIMFILGILTFGGLLKKPFGIPRNLYITTIGLAGVITVLAAIFNNTISRLDEAVGIWLVLGASVGLLFQISKMSEPNRIVEFGYDAPIPKRNMLSIGGLLVVLLCSIWTFDYGIAKLDYDVARTDADGILLDNVSANLFDKEYRVLGILTLLIILALLLLIAFGYRSNKMPAAPFMFVSFGLMAVHSAFIFRFLTADFRPYTSIRDSSTINIIGPANWAVFICAAFIFGISFRAVRAGSKL